MISFERLMPQQKEKYDEYLLHCGTRGCEYSFANLYLWGRQTAAFLDGYLVLFSHFDGHSVYPFPVGHGDIRPVLDAVIADSRERGIPCRLTSLMPQDREILEELYPQRFHFHCHRSDADYVYAIDDLAELRGRKYQQKRNHLNRFMESYPDSFVRELDAETLPAAERFIADWFSQKEAEGEIQDFRMEQTAFRRAFSHYDALGLEGLILYADGEPAAVTMGSRLTEDTFDIHFEKAREDIHGSYAAVNQAFAAALREKHPELRYLNREDDLGLPGLRKAKESYHPAFLVEKCRACLAEDDDDED